MPADSPQIGETWFNPVAQVNGIVASIDEERIYFVSLTGKRAPIPLRSVLHVWEFRKAAPNTYRRCSREGCDRNAFIQYERPRKGLEIVCPFHVPRGVESTIYTDDTRRRDFFKAETCEKCGTDGTEVFGEMPVELAVKATMWNCQTCGIWWLNGTIPEMETPERFVRGSKSVENAGSDVLNEAIRKFHGIPGYRGVRAETWVNPHNMDLGFNVFLKPGRDHELKGPQPLTLFDYLKMDDF